MMVNEGRVKKQFLDMRLTLLMKSYNYNGLSISVWFILEGSRGPVLFRSGHLTTASLKAISFY